MCCNRPYRAAAKPAALAAAPGRRWVLGISAPLLLIAASVAAAPPGPPAPLAALAETASQPASGPNGSPRDQAALLVQRTIQRLTLGDAFDAKLRQRTWVGGREVVGIGHYEQSGGGSGRFSLEMTIHDGDARHSMQQISDGKLAWTRTQLADAISLRRVDLGRIDEVYREATRQVPARAAADRGQASILGADDPAPPWMRVGGLVEMVDQIAQDFDLRVGRGTVDNQPVWILRGALRDAARQQLQDTSGRSVPTPLCPFEVRLAVSAVGDTTGFGVGLPVKVEFWSEPAARPTASVPGQSESTEPRAEPSDESAHGGAPRGRLISLLEIYAVRPIQPSPEERFRFKSDDADVTFSNDTRRYLDRITP